MPEPVIASFPLVNTNARFAFRLEPDGDLNGTGFSFGFLTGEESLFRCGCTGTQESPMMVVRRFRQVIDDLERQLVERGMDRISSCA